MNFTISPDELAEACKEERGSGRAAKASFRSTCYVEPWPTIRDAVKEHGVCLLTAIRIYRNKYRQANKDNDPFGSRSNSTVWAAYNRACKEEGIKLKEEGE